MSPRLLNEYGSFAFNETNQSAPTEHNQRILFQIPTDQCQKEYTRLLTQSIARKLRGKPSNVEATLQYLMACYSWELRRRGIDPNAEPEVTEQPTTGSEDPPTEP